MYDNMVTVIARDIHGTPPDELWASQYVHMPYCAKVLGQS